MSSFLYVTAYELNLLLQAGQAARVSNVNTARSGAKFSPDEWDESII